MQELTFESLLDRYHSLEELFLETGQKVTEYISDAISDVVLNNDWSEFRFRPHENGFELNFSQSGFRNEPRRIIINITQVRIRQGEILTKEGYHELLFRDFDFVTQFKSKLIQNLQLKHYNLDFFMENNICIIYALVSEVE